MGLLCILRATDTSDTLGSKAAFGTTGFLAFGGLLFLGCRLIVAVISTGGGRPGRLGSASSFCWRSSSSPSLPHRPGEGGRPCVQLRSRAATAESASPAAVVDHGRWPQHRLLPRLDGGCRRGWALSCLSALRRVGVPSWPYINRCSPNPTPRCLRYRHLLSPDLVLPNDAVLATLSAGASAPPSPLPAHPPAPHLYQGAALNFLKSSDLAAPRRRIHAPPRRARVRQRSTRL